MLSYLFVDLLGGLSIAESHSCYVFEDGHFYGAVTSVQQRHQGARMHGPIHDRWPDACENNTRK